MFYFLHYQWRSAFTWCTACDSAEIPAHEDVFLCTVRRFLFMQASTWCVFSAIPSLQALEPQKLITALQTYKSLLLYLTNQNNPFPASMKVETQSNMTSCSRTIALLGMWCWEWKTSASGFSWSWTHEDQESILWTKSQNNVHTSPIVQNYGWDSCMPKRFDNDRSDPWPLNHTVYHNEKSLYW